jgi:hypothetical protein
MNLSDVVRHKQVSKDKGVLELTDPLKKTDFMNMRKVQTRSGFEGAGSAHRRL